MQRAQLPVYSPLSLGSLWHGSLHAISGGQGARHELAQLLKTEYRADEAILCGSGTEALQLALRIAIARLGSDYVALPAFSCFDVASAAVAATSRIALYDLDPATLSPDLDSLDRELGGGARCVVISPLYGIPVDWDPIAELCHRHGAVIIEDAAQGHGASWKGLPLGSHGDISILSFGRGKGWTGGSGGAVLLRSSAGKALEEPVRLDPPGTASTLRDVLGVVAQWAFGRPATYGLPASLPWLGLGETIYHEALPPRAITELAAALLLRLRPEAEREAARRRETAASWAMVSPATRAAGILVPAESQPGYLRFPLRLEDGLAGFSSATEARRLGVMPSYPAVLGELPAVQIRLEPGQGPWPGAEELVSTLVTLPTHSRLTELDRERIAEMVTACGETTFQADPTSRQKEQRAKSADTEPS